MKERPKWIPVFISKKYVIVSNGVLEFEILRFWRDEETGVTGEKLLSEQDSW